MNLLGCIKHASEYKAKSEAYSLRKEAMDALNDVSPSRMVFGEFDRTKKPILRGSVTMGIESASNTITLLDVPTQTFKIEFYSPLYGDIYVSDEVQGVNDLVSYFKTIDEVLDDNVDSFR